MLLSVSYAYIAFSVHRDILNVPLGEYAVKVPVTGVTD